jgi:hypothetical protein
VYRAIVTIVCSCVLMEQVKMGAPRRQYTNPDGKMSAYGGNPQITMCFKPHLELYRVNTLKICQHGENIKEKHNTKTQIWGFPNLFFPKASTKGMTNTCTKSINEVMLLMVIHYFWEEKHSLHLYWALITALSFT